MKTEKQLRVLAKWLKNADNDIDTYRGGALEMAVKNGVQECMYNIGDLLEEILDMDDSEIESNLK